jgi:hypothetical protein
MAKNKKYATEQSTPATLGSELAQVTEGEAQPTEPKPPRAPRIVRPRFSLVDPTGAEIRFTHYALPTRRAVTGKVVINSVDTEFIVTKSQSRDKTEDRAYSYFTLPNGHTGYVSVELVADSTFTIKESAPAEPFGRPAKAEGTGEGSTLPRAEMPVEA